jgi:hypothetical protein
LTQALQTNTDETLADGMGETVEQIKVDLTSKITAAARSSSTPRVLSSTGVFLFLLPRASLYDEKREAHYGSYYWAETMPGLPMDLKSSRSKLDSTFLFFSTLDLNICLKSDQHLQNNLHQLSL